MRAYPRRERLHRPAASNNVRSVRTPTGRTETDPTTRGPALCVALLNRQPSRERSRTMSSLRSILAATALLVATSPALAVELFTPLSQALIGQEIMCAIINTGTSAIQVSADIRHFASGVDMTATSNCPSPPATLAPGATCFAQTNTVGVHPGYCHFKSSSSRVRANLIVFDANSEIRATVPATK